MLKNLRNIAVVSASTGGSRVLGLLRDVMLFAALGASLWNSAFLLAFTLPNLFRRLLGEGAMTSAMIPVFSEVLEHEGRESALRFFSQVFFRLLLVIIAVVLGGMLVLWLGARSAGLSERWALGAELSVYLLPYMLFICLSAIVAAGLNVLGRFAAPACTPMLLNIAIILSLGGGMTWGQSEIDTVYWLCGGVLVGGLLQLIVPAVDLVRQGWNPRPVWGSGQHMDELMRLLLPALLGSAILQVNIMISRVLAHSLDDSAVSVLYLSSRLMELPLGLFTVAVVTVFFPLMSKALAADDESGFGASFYAAMRLIIAISVPAAVGLYVLGEPIVELLRFGRFTGEDALLTAQLVAIYGAGLPFYSAVTLLTRGLHAGKAMRVTVKIAALCLVVNLALSVVLMRSIGVQGLAAANVLAVLLQCCLLWRALATERPSIVFQPLVPSLAKITIGALVMGCCWLGLWLLPSVGSLPKGQSIVQVGVLVPVGILVYFALLYWLRFEEMKSLQSLMARFRR